MTTVENNAEKNDLDGHRCDGKQRSEEGQGVVGGPLEVGVGLEGVVPTVEGPHRLQHTNLFLLPELLAGRAEAGVALVTSTCLSSFLSRNPHNPSGVGREPGRSSDMTVQGAAATSILKNRNTKKDTKPQTHKKNQESQ